MQIKYCIECGNKFKTNYLHKKWCSIDCKRKTRKKYMDIWRQKNKKHIEQYTQIYVEKNRNFLLQKSNKYYYEHFDYFQSYYQKNKKERNIKAQVYKKKKLKENINFKLKYYLSNRIRESLKKQTKSKSTMELIGCSIEELKQHLESQFQTGMTWKNYGFYGWHIDHIRPCASFDLSKPKEQLQCFHYSNLQPLWMEDNFKKSYKY